MLTITRNFRSLLWGGLLVATLLGLAGCKKQPFLQTVEQTPYMGLPGNLNDLQNIDLSRLRAREGFTTIVSDLEDKLKIKPVMDSLRDRVGFDPWKDIDLLIIGTRPNQDANNRFKNIVVLAQGRFAQPAARLEQMRGWLGEEYLVDPPPFQQTTDPDSGFKKFKLSAQSQYNVKQVYELNFAFPSETLMLFSFSAPLLDETLGVIAGQTPGIQKDPAWMKMIERSNISAMAWGTGNINSNATAQVAQLFPNAAALRNARQFYYDVTINQDAQVNLGLVCESIESATQLSQTIKTSLDQLKTLLTRMATQSPQAAKLLDKLKITTELETSKLFLTLTDDERGALIDEWEAMSRKKAEQATPPAPTPATPATPPAP
jgi:hypothetical protein